MTVWANVSYLSNLLSIKLFEKQMQCFVQAVRALFGNWSCHAKNRLGRHVHIKNMRVKNMTSLRLRDKLPILTLN